VYYVGVYRDCKLTQLLRESLGGATCNTCAIIHVSPSMASYSDTLQAMQLASRMHQTRLRRRSKVGDVDLSTYGVWLAPGLGCISTDASEQFKAHHH